MIYYIFTYFTILRLYLISEHFSFEYTYLLEFYESNNESNIWNNL